MGIRGAFWLFYGFAVAFVAFAGFAAFAAPLNSRQLLTVQYAQGTFNVRSSNCQAVVAGLVQDLNSRSRAVQWAAAPGGCVGGFTKVGQVVPFVVRSYLLLDGTSNKEHAINLTLIAWDRGIGAAR